MKQSDKPEPSEDKRGLWIWVLSLLNFAIAGLLGLTIYGILAALGAFAAAVTTWPLFVLLFLGLTLSALGLQIGRKLSSPDLRLLAWVVNGSTLGLHSIILIGIAVLYFTIPEQTFIIPEGYMGDVYVIYNVADGVPDDEHSSGVTYRIPRDGILRTRTHTSNGWTKDTYYYERQDGSLQRIQNDWPTTIHRTPQNIANNRDIGVYFPTTGYFSSSSDDCLIEYQRFYVGTKAYLLTQYEEKNLQKYLEQNPVECSSRANRTEVNP